MTVKKNPKSVEKLQKNPPTVVRSLAKAIHQQAMDLWQPETPSSMERLIRALGSKEKHDT